MDSTVLKRGRPLPDPTPIDLRFHVPPRTSRRDGRTATCEGLAVECERGPPALPPQELVRFQAWWPVRFSGATRRSTRLAPDWLSARRSIETGVP